MPKTATKSSAKQAMYKARMALLLLVRAVNREEIQFLSTDALEVMEHAGLAITQLNEAIIEQ